MTKKFRAKQYADLSLQFSKDPNSTGVFTITTNECNNLLNPLDEYIFAKNFADYGGLTLEEKLRICKLFNLAEEKIKEQQK